MEEIEVLDRAEISGTTVLVTYSKTESALAALRTKHAGVVFDLTTAKGDKDARSARLELVTLRTGLEKKRKEFKAPALALGKKIDSEAERITAEIVVLETFIDLQIKADEKRRADEKAEKERIEALRVQGLRDKIAGIRACLVRCNGITAERIAKGIAQVEQLNVSSDAFDELASEAQVAKVETLSAMVALHTATAEREADAARVDAQRVENERMAGVLKDQADALAAQQAAIDKAADELKAAQDAAAKESSRLEAERDRIRVEGLATIEVAKALEKAAAGEQERTACAIQAAQLAIDMSRMKNNASGQPPALVGVVDVESVARDALTVVEQIAPAYSEARMELNALLDDLTDAQLPRITSFVRSLYPSQLAA